jgi:flagellar hook-associated protein 1 FlgK
VAAQAETTRSSHSGVNLDEEAARLIQYQQSYQAAAKILQIAQTVFDTLLDAA